MDAILNQAIEARARELAALLLWQAGAMRVAVAQPFTLASGRLSPIYVNCRQVISSPTFMQLFTGFARLLCEHGRVGFDAVAGGETAGIPFAAYLARDLARPMLYVRKRPKGYGLASQVEGTLQPGWRVLLVEDLITDGGSKQGFIDALRAAGAEVRDVLVLFDRQQGGAAQLAAQGVRLHAVTERATALAAAESAGLLSAADRAAVERYFADPESWQP